MINLEKQKINIEDDMKKKEKEIENVEKTNKKKEEELQSTIININKKEEELNQKGKLIEEKNTEKNNLTSDLENIIKNEKKQLEEAKLKNEAELKKWKENAIKQFLTIKIINIKIEELTLNKSTINSVEQLVNDFSIDQKFIENKKYFTGLFNEYEIISREIDQSESPKDIYGKYGLNVDSIGKAESKDNKENKEQNDK